MNEFTHEEKTPDDSVHDTSSLYGILQPNDAVDKTRKLQAVCIPFQ